MTVKMYKIHKGKMGCNQETLLYQRSMSITGVPLTWIRNFLTGRTFQVILGSFRSARVPLLCGVPQGSAISPWLFNCYVRPVVDIISSWGLATQVYADDIQIVASDALNPTAAHLLSCCLSSIQTWMKDNRLALNVSKTEVLLTGPTQSLNLLAEWPVSMGPCPTPSSQVRNLGVIFDNKLSWIPQVRNCTKNALYYLRMLRRVKHLLSQTHRNTLVQALVISRLDFCNVVYLGLPIKWLSKLQLVQNQAARLITGTSRWDHISPVLRLLHWLPCARRIEFKALCVMFRAFKQHGPLFINNMAIHYHPPRALRSADQDFAVIPLVRLISFGGRSFRARAASLWNLLPLPLRKSTVLITFRKALKTFLFGAS